LKTQKIVTTLALLTAILATSMLASTAQAITGNPIPDGNKHPYVCLVVAYDENKQPLWRGSGSLISPTVVLTAGHVTDGAAYAAIWLDEKIAYDPEKGYPTYDNAPAKGTPYTHPDFGYYVDNNGLVGFITHDVGAVVLNEPVDLNEYGEPPSPGLVDTLKVGATVTFVGYGVQYQVTPKIGGPYDAWRGERARFYTTANLLSTDHAISSTFIKCSSNPAQGKGGTAFGDSGGPVLLGDTNTIIAVTSFGANANCAGVGYYARVDTPDVLNWINGFLNK
jgi:V8-like Glu-specific endopeptidase